MNKRGLSSVLVNILLILVVIAALSIVSVLLVAFIRTEVEGGEVRAGLLNDGVTVSVKSLDDGAKKIELVFKREGTSDSFSGVVVELVDINGKSASFEVPLKLSQFETATETKDFSSFELDKLASLNVYPYGTTSFARQIVSNVPEFVSLISMTQSNVVLPSCTFDNDPCTTNGVYPDCNVPKCGSGFVCDTLTGNCNPAPSLCGNGDLDVGEECDLGGNNGQSGYGCSATCTRLGDDAYIMDVIMNTSIVSGLRRVGVDFPDQSIPDLDVGASFVSISGISINIDTPDISQRGGFNYKFSIRNTGTNPINFDGTTAEFYLGSIKQTSISFKFAQPKCMKISQKSLTGVVDSGNYPDAMYSPFLYTETDKLAIGVSVLYPATIYGGINYRLDLAADGRYTYHFFPIGTIPGGATWDYTVVVRFAEPRNGIFTLYPYKNYFKGLYGPRLKTQEDTDVLPVSKHIFNLNCNKREIVVNNCRNDVCLGNCGTNTLLCYNNYDVNTQTCDFRQCYTEKIYTDYPTNSIANTHLYASAPVSNARLDRAGGLNSLVQGWINNLPGLGVHRVLMWGLAGHYNCEGDPTSPLYSGYDRSAKGGQNYPPHFITNLLSNVENNLNAFDLLRQNGIDLGFYWGHGGFVPDPNVWNPPLVRVADTSNSADMAFIEGEFKKMDAKGAKEVCLDALPKDVNGYTIIKKLKEWGPGTKLCNEVGGPDYITHFEDSQYTDCDQIPNFEPNFAQIYLTPGLATYTPFDDKNFIASSAPSQDPTYYSNSGSYQTYFGRAMRSGFIPLFDFMSYNRDVTSLAGTKLYTCMDGSDNNDNGLIDYYDPACSGISPNTDGEGPP